MALKLKSLLLNLWKYICSAEPTLSLHCFIWSQLKLELIEIHKLTYTWCAEGCTVLIKKSTVFLWQYSGGCLDLLMNVDRTIKAVKQHHLNMAQNERKSIAMLLLGVIILIKSGAKEKLILEWCMDLFIYLFPCSDFIVLVPVFKVQETLKYCN